MVKRVLFLSAAGVFLIGLLMSCTMPGMSDVEFAKELMAESAEATGLYEDPMASKSGGSTGGEPPIQIDLSTWEYSYSDYIVIDGKVHKTG